MKIKLFMFALLGTMALSAGCGEKEGEESSPDDSSSSDDSGATDDSGSTEES
ncbi:MAG: hypothetical protein H6741_07390 [Alphaproteobacteria bacterium]|nr:hypothetical protein [Alphaproteobacteria bacterium]